MGLSIIGGTGTDTEAIAQQAAEAKAVAEAAAAEAVLARELALAVDAELETVQTTPGPAGRSAYELACDLGYGGTPTQWVASLEGDPGTDGTDGVSPAMAIGTVTTLAVGSQATASIGGTQANPTLNVGIPTGATGGQGNPGTNAPLLPSEITMAALTAATAPAPASAAANVECLATPKATRRRVDLTNATQIRLVGLVVANGNAVGAAIKVSYMTTVAAVWAGTDTGCTLALGTGTAGTLRESGWVNLPAGAKADVTLAALVSSAFGTSAPTVGSLTVYVR